MTLRQRNAAPTSEERNSLLRLLVLIFVNRQDLRSPTPSATFLIFQVDVVNQLRISDETRRSLSMSRPPRDSQRHFNWGEPVGADGSIPLDILMDWLRDNRTFVRQSPNKYDAVTSPCMQLNHCGVKCTVDNIVRELECLTMTAWHNREKITERMYDDDLFDQYFDGHNPELVRSHREKHTRTRIEEHSPAADEIGTDTPSYHHQNWLNPAQEGGRSPMQILVDWFPENYETYANSESEDKCIMLKRLYEEMVSAGHCQCTEEKIKRKIKDIVLEAYKEINGWRRTASFNQYHDFFVNFFSGRGSDNEREPSSSENDDGTVDREAETVSENGSGSTPTANENEDESMDSSTEQESSGGADDQSMEDGGELHSASDMVPATEDPGADGNEIDQVSSSAKDDGNSPPAQPTRRTSGQQSGQIRSQEASSAGDEDRAEIDVLSGAGRSLQAASGPSSRAEVERIAALLRERQDLEQRGISKEMLDSLLPLPRF